MKCSECGEEIEKCESCGRTFEKFDEVYCVYNSGAGGHFCSLDEIAYHFFYIEKGDVE